MARTTAQSHPEPMWGGLPRCCRILGAKASTVLATGAIALAVPGNWSLLLLLLPPPEWALLCPCFFASPAPNSQPGVSLSDWSRLSYTCQCLSCDRGWESVRWAFAASGSGSGFFHTLHLIPRKNLPYLRRALDAGQPKTGKSLLHAVTMCQTCIRCRRRVKAS